MRYACFGYLEPAKMDARPKAEVEAALSECGPHLDALYKTGRVTVDAGLAAETKCIRHAGGKVSVTDGPYVESKELIGSIFIIEAQDMDAAVGLASLHPAAQIPAGETFGWRIEIQPIHYFKSFVTASEASAG